MDFPTLTDGSLRLRPYRPDDPQELDATVLMCRDEQMQQWTTVPAPYEPSHAQGFLDARAELWREGTDCTFAIEAPDDDGRPRLAGNVSIRPADVGTTGGAGSIGFALAPWARRRGLMSRAVRLALGWAFADAADGGAGLGVVHWEAHVGNWASRRVAWACGFRHEGTVRGLCEQRGTRVDGWIGSIVRGEPMQPVTPWLRAVELYGDGVVLRPWRMDDAPRVAEACRDEGSRHWLAGLPDPYTVADAQAYLRDREEQHATGRALSWCAADPGDDRCLASLSLFNLNGPHPAPEIGYWAHPDARGRGVTTAAVRAVLEHAFTPTDQDGLGLRRVIVQAAGGNAASNGVARRLGLRHVGTGRRAEQLRDGTVDDLETYEALADDD